MTDHLTTMIKNVVGHGNVRETDVPTVVNVRGGWFGKLEKGKAALLAEFRQRYTYAYLWLDDWNADLVKEIKGEWEIVSDNLFRVPQNQTIRSLYEKLYQGKWQLFFSDRALELSYDYASFAKGPRDVELLLVRSGAQVVVVSWLDDAEWFVGWQPSTHTTPSVS